MSPIIADLHTHTLASGHAYGTIRENAQAAAEKGLHILGVSEHGPGIPGTCSPIYFANLSAVPKELYGVRILHGSEINVLEGGRLSLEERYIGYLDYAIAGVHSICYANQGKKENTMNTIRCMEASSKVRFISHPDDDRTPMDYDLLCRGARDNGVALEVNNSSLSASSFRVNARENYRMMLECCEKYRVPVIVNSDAHDPSAVGRVDDALSLIRSHGFDERLILNTDEKKLLEFFRLA
ncbi:MAG: phosphatase [Clostridia bacterium]|nr:phosphatase [Clostridia bacterium]